MNSLFVSKFFFSELSQELSHLIHDSYVFNHKCGCTIGRNNQFFNERNSVWELNKLRLAWWFGFRFESIIVNASYPKKCCFMQK